VEWLLALLNVMFMNTILSGDNSIVISLAANRLPETLRKKAILWGSITAIGLRVVLLVIGTYFIDVPFFKIAAALLLMWVAVQLIRDSVKSEHRKEAGNGDDPTRMSSSGIKNGSTRKGSNGPDIEVAVATETASSTTDSSSFWKAIRTIAIADFVMSLDNAVAILGASNGYTSVIFIGLAITVPILFVGSELLSRILTKYSWLILLAVAILGWTAGDMFVDDVIFQKFSFQDTMQWLVPAVMGVGISLFAILIMVRASQNSKEKHKVA
jgi:YjbE family integral membrane protein